MKSAVQIGDATVVAVALALLARRVADRGASSIAEHCGDRYWCVTTRPFKGRLAERPPPESTA